MSDQPLTSDDRLRIQELLACYNHAVDNGDADAYVATFIETGVFEIGDTMRFEGPRQLEQVVNSPQRVRGQHINVNVAIEQTDASRATVRSYSQMLTLAGDPPIPTITAFGTFTDEVVRQDDQWRFARRRYSPNV